MLKIAIIGFGRMGLSHVSILRGLLAGRQHKISVFDPSIVSLGMAKALIPDAKIRRSFEASDLEDQDYVLFTSPPFDRAGECAMAEKLKGRVFIEKPIVATLPANAMSGYVLQHSPLTERLREELRGKKIERIDGLMQTPMDFSEATGWRASKYGEISGEFLGHVVTMALAPLSQNISRVDHSSFKVIEASTNVLKASIMLNGEIKFNIELRGGSGSLRKTGYRVDYRGPECALSHDLYTIKRGGAVVCDVAQNQTGTQFYLRGFEYSKQMQRLISGEGDVLSRKLICEIDHLSQLSREQ